MIELVTLCRETWKVALPEERSALQHVAGLQGEVSPVDVFTTIARSSPHLDPRLSVLLWNELELTMDTPRAEIHGLPLSERVTQTMQLVLAYELGRRIDRAMERLATMGEEVGLDELERIAATERVPWKVLLYALAREEECSS